MSGHRADHCRDEGDKYVDMPAEERLALFPMAEEAVIAAQKVDLKDFGIESTAGSASGPCTNPEGRGRHRAAEERGCAYEQAGVVGEEHRFGDTRTGA